MADSEPRRIRQERGNIERILNKLDAEVNPQANEVREDIRYRYRLWAASIRFEVSNGQQEQHLAPTRNVSRRGMGLLVGNYVYPGTRCQVKLVQANRKTQAVTGTVRHCYYYPGSGSVHVVGVQFDEPIDVHLFQEEAPALPVLLIDADSGAAERIREGFEPLVVRVVEVAQAAPALRLVLEVRPVAIFLNMSIPGLDGFVTAHAIRRLGYKDLLVALSQDTSPSFQERCKEAGIDECVSEAFQPEKYRDAVAGHQAQEKQATESAEEVMYKLEQFMADLPERFRQFQQVLAQENLGDFARLARSLESASQACGMEIFAEMGENLRSAAEAGVTVERLQMQVAELATLCQLGRRSKGS